MKKLLITLMIVIAGSSAFGQWIWSTNYNITPSDSLAVKGYFLIESADSTEALAFDTLWLYLDTRYAAIADSMTYPSAGIPLSTGSAWGTSITNNSTNWNTAYGWGDHSVEGYALQSALEDTAADLRTAIAGLAGGHDAVTLAGTPDYITLVDQVITRNAVDLTADVTGVLPDANVANDITASNYEPLLTNSAGLASALSDETGTGVAVFGTAPTFTTSIQLGSTIIDETELSTIDGTTGYFDSDTTFWLLSDTIVLGSFSKDTTRTSDFYGSFYNNGSDTLVVTSMTAVLQGSTPSVTVDVQWHATFNSASATHLNTTPPTITSTTTGDSDTTFDNAIIPPGVWVWMETPTVTTPATYISVSISGYRLNRTY